ncbi:MAG: hypothetical protein CMJ83_07345 [Planctomycetes bacterium]|nr:hypothetical protein [Planctomycetota bacterium]
MSRSILASVPFALLLLAVASAQVQVTAGPYASAGGNQHKHVVKDQSGNLFCLTVADPGTGDRPLLLSFSSDDGQTWAPLGVQINDSTSGLNAPNATNGCCMAIDSLGVLHVVWGNYYYPSYFAQFYRQYDTSTTTLSAVVNLSTLIGAAPTSRTSALNVAVDANDTVWIAGHGTLSWRSRLIYSDQPNAANLAFTDVGPISTSASAQNARLAIDATGLVHCSYYRNTGSGEYWHRIYNPGTGWQTSTRIGNTQPTNDYYGTLCADSVGFVHAVYGVDLYTSTTWQFEYRQWDPLTGSWGAPIPIFSATTAQYTGVANYRIFAAACDEATGKVSVVWRDLAGTGALALAEKDLTANSFTNLGDFTSGGLGQHEYYLPALRGALYPAFNNTGSDLDITWRQNAAPGPYQLMFLRVGNSAPVPTLTLLGPVTPGVTTSLDISSPADPNLAFVCGFSLGTSPGINLGMGQIVPLTWDFLFDLSITPNNGIFVNNIGALSGAGTATAMIVTPNLPALTGLTIYAAFAVAGPNSPTGIGTISSALTIPIQ